MKTPTGMQNDIVARALRQKFQDDGIFVVSLVASPGSGTTAFLERTLTRLREKYQVAALVGDLATDNHAACLARSGAPVKQIVDHLDAEMVRSALDGWMPHPLDFLFLENVGSLVSPASCDLGEDLRLVLISVTEGEDKPLKYPTIFNTADLAIITKTDLANAEEFNAESALQNIQAVHPGIRVMQISTKTGAGFEEWIERLIARYEQDKADCDHPSDVALNDPSVKVVDANWVRHL